MRCLDQRERRSRGTPAVPYIKLAAVADEQSSTLTLFALNRNLAEPMTIAVVAKGFCDLAVIEAPASWNVIRVAARLQAAPVA